ncbi:putative defense protein isoform X1 [Lytechinus variegatus]|uniref:putative defense protein isoform X1 n=1 Tax=Lytechinus variegatus TaxID=7654 RepID=UPI001BB25E59|nr:putative defense protein isoform X1 [Lytechinus variegatus]
MAGSSKPFNLLVISKIVVMIVCLVHNSKAYPGGAPIQTCSHMTPQHSSSPQTSNSPYTMSISHAAYTPGQQITVTISKDSASAALKGILIQARRETSSDGDQIIGTWSHGDATNFKYLACEGANSAITHANNNDKAATIEFNWTPPETNGAVYFTATFVQLRSVFWVAERTNSIERDPASDPCNPNPCLSGGDCNQNGNMFTCNCPELTTGSTCEMTLNPCDSNPCLNGGNCTNSADNATYMCNCPFNYTGATCQPDLPSTTESISGTVLLTDRSSTTGKGRQLLCSLHLMMTAVMVLITFL